MDTLFSALKQFYDENELLESIDMNIDMVSKFSEKGLLKPIDELIIDCVNSKADYKCIGDKKNFLASILMACVLYNIEKKLKNFKIGRDYLKTI